MGMQSATMHEGTMSAFRGSLADCVSSVLALPTMRQTILRIAETTARKHNISINLVRRMRIPVREQNLQVRFSESVARAQSMTHTAN